MISFALDEEEKMIKDTAESFGKVLREGMRKWEKEGVPYEIISKYEETGFGMIDVPEDIGGSGLGFFKKVLTLENLAYGCAGTTLYLELPSLIKHIFVQADPQIKQKYKDKKNLSFFIDFDGVFEIKEDGSVSGKANAVLGKNIRTFLLLKDGKVFVFDDFQSIPKKPLALDAVGVNEVKVNSKPKEVFELKDQGKYFISVVRLYLSAIQSGIIRASFDYSSKYAMERVAFGKKIAHHQGMAFILSDFSIAVSACQLYTYKAAWSLDTKQEDFFRVCADCFAFVSETAEKFTVWGVQILGGHGFVKDHPVEKWMREAKAISLLFGGKHYAEIDAEQII
jgi:alkylation response protein AidB-like acyl-CoA dehydrogenase